jgi:cell wall-associated NlpC family hydrolase
MAPHNTTPEGFRTVAYLATKARLDAARSRTGKTSRNVTCTPPNVKCGGRCIPPNWDCRLKGQGPDPQLRAVKTDPLGGLANIQRGATRIAKGVAKGSFSEVEGGKRAIIRGVVKATPGDLQRKRELQATLENRTRAIGIGLAVVTGGLGAHALLMKSNPFGYRQGVGANINNAARLGMSRILDATPVIGANRARVRRQVGAAIGAQLERQANPVSSVLTNQLARTRPSQADVESGSNLVKAITAVDNKFAGAVARFGPGLSEFDRWDREHQKAFFNTTKKEKGVGLANEEKGNIFARPATNEFLARQFNLRGDDVLTTDSIKDAIKLQLTEYKSSLLDLAQQQGFNVKTKGANRVLDDADRRRFIKDLVQTTLPKGKSNNLVRSKLTEHLEDTLRFTPLGRTDKLYSDTYKGFNDFYTEQGEVISSIADMSRMTQKLRDTGAEQVLLDGRLARAQYLLQFKKQGAGKQIKGGAHAEVVLRDYFATQVSKAPRQMYTITERLAAAAASELEGRPVSARDAFNVLEREGFTGAVPAAPARPARAARGAQAQIGELARSLREAAQRRGEDMSLEASYRAARAEIARRQRGDSTEHDLPPRVRAYLATRADFKEGGRLGKPCGASHIPKAHECRKGAGSAPAKETPESGTSTRRKAAAAALAVAAIGATAATGAYVIQDMKSVAKQPNVFAPTPSTRTIAKAAKKEFDTKKSGTAMGNYYTKKSGLKPGDVVYYRNEKDPAAHFGIYIGEGKDGKVRAVMANTNEKRAGFVDVIELGTTKPDSNDAAHFLFPVLQKAPPLKGAKARTNEETVRRALRAVGTDYKFSLTRDNCEVLANSIAYDTPRSQQLERFKRLTRGVADSTIGVRQRAGMAVRRARGQRKTTALSAQQILQRLSKDDNSFLTDEGRDIARNHYSQYFESGAKLDAAPMPPALISPDQLWDRIKNYDDDKKAIAMRDYLLVLRLALDTNAAA